MNSTAAGFDYDLAFSRNIGWVTQEEQRALGTKRVAIAGLGGVGGIHLLTLARLGVQRFAIADFDTFGIENFNRQVGATMSTVGESKLETLARMVRDINPTAELSLFRDGVDGGNVDAFLSQADLYVDSLDFFALSARRLVFAACAERRIPAVTAAPLGMSAAVLAFVPGGMTFEQYFRLDGCSESEMQLRFLLGLAPRMLHRGYLVDPSRVNLEDRRGPSTMIACQLCAGTAAAESLKILLQRGNVISAPWGYQFDGYRCKLVKTWRPGGNGNPLQRLTMMVARHQLAQMRKSSHSMPLSNDEALADSVGKDAMPIERVLDLARWAPSGDNTQCWRFELIGPSEAMVHGHDTRDHCVYDLDGHASHLSIGALLRTIRIAATSVGARADIDAIVPVDDRKPRFRVRLSPDSTAPHALLPSIKARTVCRRRMSTRRLTSSEKTAVESGIPAGYRAVWFEALGERLQWANLLSLNGKLRLLMPEGYAVHRDIIEWDVTYSARRIPEGALGMSPASLSLTRWAMADWSRINFVNRLPGGTWMPRVELDWLPTVSCGAVVAVIADREPVSVLDHVNAGEAVQCMWLTLTSLGLVHQPAVTPIVFSRFLRDARRFSKHPDAEALAGTISKRLATLLGRDQVSKLVWLGRAGERLRGDRADARSVRMPMSDLVIRPAGAQAHAIETS